MRDRLFSLIIGGRKFTVKYHIPIDLFVNDFRFSVANMTPITANGLMTLFMMMSLTSGLYVVDLTHILEQGKDQGWPVHPHYNFSVLSRTWSDEFGTW